MERASLIISQSPPWRYIDIMDATPHCSPWSALPGYFRSMVWEIMCSEPLVGLELLAMHMENPEIMMGLMATQTLSSRSGLMRSESSMMDSAAYLERA